MDRIQELSLDELHHDLVELQAQVKQMPAKLALAIPQPKEQEHMHVTVTNPVGNGRVEVTNQLEARMVNISDLLSKLDSVIAAVKADRDNSVKVLNPITISNLTEVTKLLKEISGKDSVVKVAAPQVKVDVDKVSIDNFPRDPKQPIAVRLSDGERFISEIVRVISGSGGSSVPLVLISDNSLRTTDAEYSQKITTVGTVTYIAKSAPGTAQASATWQVQKVDETSGTVITWADGNASFDNVATDLTSLSYS